MTLYDVAYCALATVVAPVLLFKSLTKGKYRRSVPGMFGNQIKGATRPFRDGCVWIHAVSFGEITTAQAIVPQIRRMTPLPILLTTTTETGFDRAMGLRGKVVDEVAFAPADFSWVVRRFINHFEPRALLLCETELWPNMLTQVNQLMIPAAIVNAKLSDKSFEKYQRLPATLKKVLTSPQRICVQTPRDREKFVTLGANADKVAVCGNVKFDAPTPQRVEEELQALRSVLGINDGDKVIILGSTHAGEEEALLRALAPFLRQHEHWRILLVPRHPERFDAAFKTAKAIIPDIAKFSDLRTGSVEEKTTTRVVVVDQMGLLQKLYGLADVAIVAGSFVPGIGGHNIVEAASLNVPVIYGPHMHSQPDMLRLLPAPHCAVQCEAAEVGHRVDGLLSDDAKRNAMTEAATAALRANRGAADKVGQCLSPIFERITHNVTP